MPQWSAWRASGLAFAIATIALVLANRQLLVSWVMLGLHAGHESSFVIFTASGWLLWRSRVRLGALAPRPEWIATLALGLLTVAVWFAYLVDVQVAQAALFVASFGALVWALLGPAVLRVTLFPIAFLFLAVPVWNHLEPLLQTMTVRATVIALRLTGVPVYVDETYIQVPDRTVIVLARCSGVQFFHAGLIIGALSAYLNFRLLRVQAAVFGAFVAMAIIGNWVRVYALVFVGVLTGQQHFMFGWLVFACALVPAVVLSRQLQRYEDARPPRIEEQASQPQSNDGPVSAARLVAVTAAATLLVAAGPFMAGRSAATAASAGDARDPIVVRAPWFGPYAAGSAWRPAFARADAQAAKTYRLGNREVMTYWAYYAKQQQGAEVVNELNVIYDTAQWQPRGGYAGTDYQTVTSASGQAFEVIETRLQNLQSSRERLVWHWYRVGGQDVAEPWRAKLAQLRGLLANRSDASVVAVSTDADDLDEARALLHDFVLNNMAAGVAGGAVP
jgi:EpsI family protein